MRERGVPEKTIHKVAVLVGRKLSKYEVPNFDQLKLDYHGNLVGLKLDKKPVPLKAASSGELLYRYEAPVVLAAASIGLLTLCQWLVRRYRRIPPNILQYLFKMFVAKIDF